MILLEKKIKFAKSKFGRIEFRYTEGFSDRGNGDEWILNKVDALLDGKEIGYLKINYIPKSIFSTKFRDILSFIVVQHGAYDLKKAMESGDTKEIIKKMSQLSSTYPTVDDILIKKGDVEDLKWWKKKYEELLEELNKKYGREFKGFVDY